MHTRQLTAILMATLLQSVPMNEIDSTALADAFGDARAIVRMCRNSIDENGNFEGDDDYDPMAKAGRYARRAKGRRK